MLKRTRIFDAILVILFVFSLVCFLLRIRGAYSTTYYSQKEIEGRIEGEQFDIKLLRLNSVNAIIAYCDSIYKAANATVSYPDIVSSVMRDRFYHGYSYYSSGNNSMGVIFAPLTNKQADAIVVPDDITKYPYAACSQQSIVGMELFKRKKYDVRKIAMFDTATRTGHFAFEVYYDRGWHFFDTNMEPDTAVLNKYHRPSVAFLASHPNIVVAAYGKRSDPAMFVRLLQSYKHGTMNEFPAPRAYLYQEVSKFLTHFGWAIIWGVFLLRGYVRRKKEKDKIQNSAIPALN